MSKPAARVGDMHTCPMVTPGTPPIPHVGGPITTPGGPNVIIGGMPAATVGSMCTCVGPPDSIIMGSTGVFICGKPAARMGDPTAHGGVVTVGMPTVLIGEIAPSAVSVPPSPMAAAMIAAAKAGVPFCEECFKAGQEAGKDKKGESKDEVSVHSGELEFGSAEDGASAKMSDKLVFAGYEASYDAERGLYGEFKGSAGIAEGEIFGHYKVIGGEAKAKLLTASVEASSGVTLLGASAKGTAKASVAEGEAAAFLGTDPNNPFLEAKASGELLSAEAKGDVLFGHDGKRTGIALKGSLGASLAKGDVEGAQTISLPRWVPILGDYSIEARARVGGDAGAVGIGGGGHGYYDHETKRVNVGGGVKAKALLGVEFDFNISIGKKYENRERPDY